MNYIISYVSDYDMRETIISATEKSSESAIGTQRSVR